MIGIRRFFHAGRLYRAPAKGSSLAELRKSTGYSISNCKKALTLFPDDVEKAEDWLHEEAKQKGWSKWAKIQGRSATQGLVGVYCKNRVGAMLEINCETDFVARNSEFQVFVSNILASCLNHVNEYDLSDDVLKVILDESQINALKFESSRVEDLIRAATCKFNEKTVTKRAVCYRVADSIMLGGMSHPSTDCDSLHGATLGRYGALIAFRHNDTEIETNINEVSQNLCQHIIGMNPTTIGHFTEKDLVALKEKKLKSLKKKNEEEAKPVTESSTEDSEEKTDDADDTEESDEETEAQKAIKESNELRLLHQPFLLDPDVLVGEVALKSAVEVLQFDRFECGENLAQENEQVEQSVNA